MNHFIHIIKVDATDELEGYITFLINGNEYEAFYWGNKFNLGEALSVDLDQLEYPLKWEVIFGENKNK